MRDPNEFVDGVPLTPSDILARMADRLGEVDLPVLLVHGTDDKLASPEGSRAAAAANEPLDFH